MRIISLLPSLTEICGALGLADNLVGITHGCDYPLEAVAGKQVVTSSVVSPYTMSQAEIHEIVTGALANGHSLYGLDPDLVKAADADIVLTQALCDVCAVSYPKVLSTCAKVLTDERPRVVSLERWRRHTTEDSQSDVRTRGRGTAAHTHTPAHTPTRYRTLP